MKRNSSDNRDSTNEQPFSHYYVDRNSWLLFLWKEVEDMKTDDV